MRLQLKLATPDDVADLIALREAVNLSLRAQFGEGLWLAKATEKGTLFLMRRSSVYVARRRGKLVATLALSTRKPWAIDKKHFRESRQPLYLTSMAVHPAHQRKGEGRSCIDEARRIALQWPSDAIRLDAYDVPAGAGEFYRKCGFTMVGRATYRGAPLAYYELLL
jgi:GNAT superfamily N-acetyltransferase